MNIQIRHNPACTKTAPERVHFKTGVASLMSVHLFYHPRGFRTGQILTERLVISYFLAIFATDIFNSCKKILCLLKDHF